MNFQKTFPFSTSKADYTIRLLAENELHIQLKEKFSLSQWKSTFTRDNVKDITVKTGLEVSFEQFTSLLVKSIEQKDISCYIDILSTQDLQNLKARNGNANQTLGNNSKTVSKSNKRYLIVTYMAEQNKYHYPLALTAVNLELEVPELKQIYAQLRVELQSARVAALNDTVKSQNSFSIQYDKKTNGKHQARMKDVDQHRSENEILKAKLARLEEQAEKKKANIQIEAAIERTKQLKQSIETANLELVDWKNKVQDQDENHNDIKKQLSQLHKKICQLLTTQKQVNAKKKGDQVQKQLNQVKNATKKNHLQIERLKKELQASKNKVKELQVKAKKLNSEKQVIRKGGKRGPYSSAGSVRSYNSYNSFNSSKKSYNSNVSGSSKAKSNYTYNSYKYR